MKTKFRLSQKQFSEQLLFIFEKKNYVMDIFDLMSAIKNIWQFDI